MSLNLTDITLTYPDGVSRLTALDRVTLQVPEGSLTAVIGPSGSGKSSLLAVAATLIAPDTGTVTIDGTPTTGLTRGELTYLRRNKIGIVFQQPNLLPSSPPPNSSRSWHRSTAATRAPPTTGPWNCSTPSAWPTRPAGAPTSSPAASASASTSLAP